VLNADFRPMSYFPLSLLSWQDAVHAVFSERVSAVAEYDTWARSPSTRIRLPSVVGLRKYQRAPRRVAFTRFNVFLRDRFRCQYCGEAFASSALTVRARHPALARRPDDLVEHRHSVRPMQHGQVQLAAAAPAEGADAQRAAGGKAHVSARLSARELDRLPLLGRAPGRIAYVS
jgi:5-methylcytosine-specific restriction endonuclease McrA